MAISNKEKKQLKTEPKLKVELNDEQKNVIRKFYEYDVNFVLGDFGCLSKGTKVLMFNGEFKTVENIIVGDQLMGIDSKPRNVLSLKRGVDQMYIVKQKKGNEYRVNSEHILSLNEKTFLRRPRYTDENGNRKTDFTKPANHEVNEFITNISVKDYINLNKTRKTKLKGYISPKINFKDNDLSIDPYYLGLWLGDGSKHDIRSITNIDKEIIYYLENKYNGKWKGITYIADTNETIELKENFKKIYNLSNCNKLSIKYIPKEYLITSEKNRLNLLAGLIDSDGYYDNQGYYEIIQKNKKLANDIAFLTRSLGFRTNLVKKKASLKIKNKPTYYCDVYRISFRPDIEIPIKIERKKSNYIRKQIKDDKIHGIEIIKDTVDNFYGFELDGDKLFILEDFTVTHNCGKSLVATYAAIAAFRKKQFNKIWITRPMLKNNLAALPGTMEEKMFPYVFPILQNLEVCQGKETTTRMRDNGDIEVMPIEVAKGITFIDSVVIVDEFQDMTYQDFRTILTRLGKDSKIIFCGSEEQVDKLIGKNSCIKDVLKLKDTDFVGFTILESNHRNPVLTKIINYLEK